MRNIFNPSYINILSTLQKELLLEIILADK